MITLNGSGGYVSSGSESLVEGYQLKSDARDLEQSSKTVKTVSGVIGGAAIGVGAVAAVSTTFAATGFATFVTATGAIFPIGTVVAALAVVGALLGFFGKKKDREGDGMITASDHALNIARKTATIKADSAGMYDD